MLSYDALSEGVSADDVLEQVLGAVQAPDGDRLLRDTQVQDMPIPVRAG